MIGYSVIVAVLLVYLHSINAEEPTYTSDPKQLHQEMLEEMTAHADYRRVNRIPLTSRNFVCEILDNDRRKNLCNKIMVYMINAGEKDDVFETFVETDCSRPKPQLAELFSNDHYKCQNLRLEVYNLDKGMYWCKSKQYKTQSGKIGEADGFFCGEALLYPNRVYAFRPPQLDSKYVDPVGQVNGYDIFKKE